MTPAKAISADSLNVRIHASSRDMAADAAREAAAVLTEALAKRGAARVILATGNSQIQFLENLTAMKEIDWQRITLFHMDEYLGISAAHPASFRRYLRERVEQKAHPRAFHYIEGDALEPLDECDRYARLLQVEPVDLCCLGIGENGHLAFNDPPVADFDDPHRVKIVKLDPECRQQQVGEGHFPNLDAVPMYAITLTIPALCAAKRMLCIAPEKRKARAVKNVLQGPIDAACPGSILRRMAHCTLLLDEESAGML